MSQSKASQGASSKASDDIPEFVKHPMRVPRMVGSFDFPYQPHAERHRWLMGSGPVGDYVIVYAMLPDGRFDWMPLSRSTELVYYHPEVIPDDSLYRLDFFDRTTPYSFIAQHPETLESVKIDTAYVFGRTDVGKSPK